MGGESSPGFLEGALDNIKGAVKEYGGGLIPDGFLRTMPYRPVDGPLRMKTGNHLEDRVGNPIFPTSGLRYAYDPRSSAKQLVGQLDSADKPVSVRALRPLQAYIQQANDAQLAEVEALAEQSYREVVQSRPELVSARTWAERSESTDSLTSWGVIGYATVVKSIDALLDFGGWVFRGFKKKEEDHKPWLLRRMYNGLTTLGYVGAMGIDVAAELYPKSRTWAALAKAKHGKLAKDLMAHEAVDAATLLIHKSKAIRDRPYWVTIVQQALDLGHDYLEKADAAITNAASEEVGLRVTQLLRGRQPAPATA